LSSNCSEFLAPRITEVTCGCASSQASATCATDTSTSNDATCLDAFIKKFGARALRRPLATDEVTFYTTAYGSSTTASAAAYADLIALFVTAPEFMYFVEHGDTAISGQTGVYDVSPYELASRLSYQLWQTAPDDALLSAAADGSLRDATTYNAQVARLLADPRARPALDEFFADWMKVEDLPALDAKNADATFKTFAGGDLPDAKLRQAMIDDVVGMLDYYTWTTPAGISALLTSDLSFARDARLAKLVEPELRQRGAQPGGGPPLERVVGLVKDRANSIPQLADEAMLFYAFSQDAKPVVDEKGVQALRTLKARLGAVSWERAAINDTIKDVVKTSGLKMPQVAMPLRHIVTGRTQTPSIDAVLELLGRERVLHRLAQYLETD